MRRVVLGFLFAFGCAASASAQPGVSAAVSMDAQPRVVQVGEIVRLTVQAQVTGTTNVQMELPDLSAFDVLNRQVSTPMQVRFGFGTQAQMIQSTTVHRLLLRARQPGTFALAPATALVDGQRFQSNPLTIQVGGTAVDPGSAPQPPASDVAGFDPNGFVRTVVDVSQPYVGQQVTATVYLYARQAPSGLNITQEPTTEGFWVQDLLPPTRSLEGQQQIVNGIPFQVYVLRRFAAFPLRAGTLTIGGTAVSTSSGGLFDIFAPTAPMSRVGGPTTVEVRELPTENRPAGEPHVGTLELEARLEPTQVATGDAVQLTVTARGNGMLRQLRIPDPSAPGLRVLAPEIDDQIAFPQDLVGGTRTFRWLVVPEREGTYTLGPFSVPVLEPRTGRYSVARADAIRLTAAGNPVGGGAPEPEPAPSARSGAAPALTLGPIRTRSELARSHTPLADAPWIPFAFGLGPLALLGALGVRIARGRGGASPARAAKQATRDARRRLSSASEHARAGNAREFYAAIAQALKEVLEAKLARPVGSLTHGELRRLLVERGMVEGLADRVVDELEGCDFARFSAAGVRTEEMQSCLERTRGLLGELDRFVPRKEEDA